jgi:hypothetical protein
VAVVAAAVVALAVVLLVRAGTGSPAPRSASGRTPAPSVSAVVSPSPAATTPTPTPSATASEAAASSAPCTPAAHDFLPRSITVRGVTRGADVLALHRDAEGIPATPPISSYGKTVFAFDRDQGVEPGDPAGNVLLNAHTWPDGSALGNHLLAGLHKGGRIVVRGEGDTELCYRVTERVEVRAVDGLPRYYATNGPPQLAIVVCSGTRTGPGQWTHRTVWFASPQA